MPAIERSRVLRRAVEIIRDRNDELAALDTLDAGRPIGETTTEDVVWWMRQKARDLGYTTWFQTSVDVQRQGPVPSDGPAAPITLRVR